MTYALLSIAFVLFALRGLCEYVVTATGTAPGWRLPSWISRERDDARRASQGLPPRPGWMFWRDSYHLFQMLRDVCMAYGVLASAAVAPGLGLGAAWSLMIALVAWVPLRLAGHGVGFTAVNWLYNNRAARKAH